MDAVRGQGAGGRRALVWATAGALLLVPLVAMRFTAEVVWTAGDFVFAAVLLFGALGSYELLARATASTSYRAGAGLAILGMVMLVWINAAVGIIGSEDNDANLTFGAVIAVIVVGAVAARFRAAGMALAMALAAAAQTAVAAIALTMDAPSAAPVWPRDLLLMTGFFVALWLASAWLLRRASRSS